MPSPKFSLDSKKNPFAVPAMATSSGPSSHWDSENHLSHPPNLPQTCRKTYYGCSFSETECRDSCSPSIGFQPEPTAFLKEEFHALLDNFFIQDPSWKRSENILSMWLRGFVWLDKLIFLGVIIKFKQEDAYSRKFHQALKVCWWFSTYKF